MAITFDLGLKSLKGFYVGMFPSIKKAITQPSWSNPTSTTGFDIIGSNYSNTNYAQYLQYLEEYFPSLEGMEVFTLADLKTWLYANGNVGTEYADVLEFRLIDNTTGQPVPKKMLCLSMQYTGPSDMVIPAKMRLKTYNDDGVSYTYQDLTIARGWRAWENGSVWEPGVDYFPLMVGAYSVNGEICFYFGMFREYNWGSIHTVDCEGFGITKLALETLLGENITLEEEEESSEAGEASQEDGYGKNGKVGTFDFHSDPITIPPKPDGVSDMGFINIYKVSAGSLSQLGGTLFPDVSAASDVKEAITALSEAFWNSKLIDYVISIHIIPGNVPASTAEDIKIGTRTLTGILGSKVTNDYVDISLGSISTAGIYANFCDFMVRCRLFLPFYGMVEIAPEYWMDGTISVDYRINVVDGSFIAFVRAKSGQNRDMTQQTLIGQYSGCASIQCPTSGVAYGSMFSGMVGGGAGLAASVASGNIAGVSTSLMTVANSVGGEEKGSNCYNASAAFMGCRTPYLIVEAPVPQFSANYANERGIPSIVTRKLGACSGFTIADDAILSGIPCTDDEKNRIREALKTGLIF